MRAWRIRRTELALLLWAGLAVVGGAQTSAVYGPIATPALTIGSGPTITASGGGTSKFLRADGQWATVATSNLPFVQPEIYGAKGDGAAYFDGAITPPPAVQGSASGTSATPATPSITTAANNSLVLYAFLGNAAWTTAPGTGTNRILQTFSAGTYALTVNDQIAAAAGSVGAVSGTLASSVGWVVGAMALQPAAGSSISYVGQNNLQSTTSSLSVNVPTGTASGNLLVACVDWYTGGNTITWPSDFVNLFKTKDAGGDEEDCGYARVPASVPASYTWSHTGTSSVAIGLLSYAGANTASVLTSATAGFSSAVVGEDVCTSGTGVGGAQQCGTITAYNSSTSVNVGYPAQTTPASIWFVYGTDDTAAFNAMLTSAPCSTVGCRIQFQPHEYMLTSAFTLPPDRTIQFLGSGFGLSNTENSYLNGNTAPNANIGTRLNWATTSLGKAAMTIGGTAHVTSTAAFDMLSDLTLYGGAGRGRDGGGGNGIDILNWQGVMLNRVAVTNFSGSGVHIDVVTSSSYQDYLEQIVLEGLYALWNGQAGVQIGSTNIFANNIETVSLRDGVLENNGGPGLDLAGKAIQGLTVSNTVIQWNNVNGANPEIRINYATGPNAPTGCSIQSNYVEVDSNGGSHSSSWVTPDATGCAVLNNFIASNPVSGFAGINTTTPLTQFAVKGSITLGDANTDVFGYDVAENATAAITSGQLVCLDTANADSVIVCPTTTTAQMVGFADGAIGASAVGPVRTGGKASGISSTPCTIGQYVVASSTTAGDVACTGTLPAQGAMLGWAETAVAATPGAVTVLIDKR